MTKVLGVGMIVLALVLAIAPAFTDCASHGKMLTTADGRSVPMKCHWTGIAEMAAAVPLGIAGLYALGGRRRETLRFAGMMGLAAGLVAILLPTTLIGTCMSASMVCNVLMKPILLSAGALTMVAGLGVVLSARERQPIVVGAAA